MPYLKGDCVIPLGQVSHRGKHGLVVTTADGSPRCMVQFEDGSEEEYDEGALTLTECTWQARMRGLMWRRGAKASIPEKPESP